MKKSSSTFILLSLAVVLLNILTAQAQKKQILLIDNFTKADFKTKGGCGWYTYTDSSVGGGSQSNIFYVNELQHKSKVLQFSYFLQEKNWKYVPYTAMYCQMAYAFLPLVSIKGIAYEYKGSQHNFQLMTFSGRDYVRYIKAVPESKEWATVIIPFDSLSQQYAYGMQVPLNIDDVHALIWKVEGKTGDTGIVYIDNIRFVEDTVSTEAFATYMQTKRDSIAETIFAASKDSGFLRIIDFKNKSKRYFEAFQILEDQLKRADSLKRLVKASSFSMKQKLNYLQLIELSTNGVSRDVQDKVTKSKKNEMRRFNKFIPLSFIYSIERKYKAQLLVIECLRLWANDVWNYSATNKINFPNGQNPDSVFKKEIELYQFDKNDTIAEIGAGSGYFEQVISKYADDLTVYVNEIDATTVNDLETKVSFLDFYDHKNIRYIALTGEPRTTHLPSDRFDKLIVKNTFHHFGFPVDMLNDFKRIMKKDGTLFIVDIMKDEVDSLECKFHLTRKVFMDYLTENGFVLIKETSLDYGKYRCFAFQRH